MLSAPPTLSVVVPLRNEEEVVDAFVDRLRDILDEMNVTWEAILVDDGSSDGTYGRCLDLRSGDERVKVVRLSRSFGHQVALTAGLHVARGDAAITMDGDLQHPPEVIPDLVQRWRDGAHVVYAVMVERQGESRFKDVTARWFYRMLNRLADIDVPAGAGDFRLVDRAALDAFRAMPEANRYLRGMFSWVGFDQEGISYVSSPRVLGTSKYAPRQMLRLATDAIVGFSDRPLRIALNCGFLVSLASIVFGLSAGVAKLAGVFVVPGWASVMVLVGVVGGVQLIVVGIIGEYVGRIADDVRNRPLYVVRAVHGIDQEIDS